MKLLLVFPDKIEVTYNLVSGLKQSGHEVVYLVGTGKKEDKFPGIIFHDHWDAWVGVPPKELTEAKFDPPGEELIKKLADVESIIITMMNKHFEKMGVDERKLVYYNLLGYWHGVLNKYKPEAIVFSSVPHPGYSYLIFELARMLNIKTLILQHITDLDRLVWYNDFWQGSRVLQEELIKNRGKNFALNDLDRDLQAYLEYYANDDHDATPEYFREVLKKHNFKRQVILKIRLGLKSIADFTFAKRVFSYFKKLFFNNIRKDYRRYYNPSPDFSKKFIYVPLHYQPECNTSPQGGVFVSQIFLVKTLSAALPKDWIIYVKEHPGQWLALGLNYNGYRFPGYYRQLVEINNVQLIPIETNSFSLINQSQAVATVTGSVGWEAILRHKPALIFGSAWYNDYPGIFKIDGVLSCRSALKKIESGYSQDNQSVINYLKCLELSSIKGPLDKLAEPGSAKEIIKIINQELKKVINGT